MFKLLKEIMKASNQPIPIPKIRPVEKEFDEIKFVKQHVADISFMFPKSTASVAKALVICQNSDAPNTYGFLLGPTHRATDDVLISFVTSGSLLKLLYSRERKVYTLTKEGRLLPSTMTADKFLAALIESR